MAASDSALAFVTQQELSGHVVVQEHPRLDLDSYIQNYTGRTRFDRLLFIGKSSVTLCVDALKAAVAEAKSGQDVSRYKEAWDLIRQAAPNEPEAHRDEAWLDATDKSNKAETLRLETELKGYRNNLIKESIRMGNEDLGRHFERIGQLPQAAEAYIRMRQDVSTTKHITDCGIHLASVAMQRRDWPIVLTNIGKITSVQSSGDDDKGLQAFTKVISGIALLGMGNFLDAARQLLHVDFAIPPTEYSSLASPNDIAIYGGLLALATMDRAELQRNVLDNQSFRSFLENEPLVRKAVSSFVNGRYSNCLSILESSRPDYTLDIYLASHINEIYSRIRTKCIVQYFIPYSCVTLESLEHAFARPGQSVENELVAMIRSGSLRARIDAKNKLLVAVQLDARAEMQRQALEVAQRYEEEAKERLRRMGILAAGLEVVGGRRGAQVGVDEGLQDMGMSMGSEIDANI